MVHFKYIREALAATTDISTSGMMDVMLRSALKAIKNHAKLKLAAGNRQKNIIKSDTGDLTNSANQLAYNPDLN